MYEVVHTHIKHTKTYKTYKKVHTHNNTILQYSPEIHQGQDPMALH